MRMGKRRPGTPVSGGGGIFRKSLVRHIELCPNKNPTVDELVSYLRSEYKKYERTKLRDLTRHVNSILQETHSKKLKNSVLDSRSSSCGSGSDSDSSDEYMLKRAKKGKKLDKDEEKLQKMEMRHIINNRRNSGMEENGVSSVSSSDEEEVSTSEDAIYGEEYEPKFDLMKSQLRDSYGGKREGNEKRKKVGLDDEVMELEVVHNNNSKRNQKVDLLKDGGNKKMGVVRKGGELEGGGGSGEKSDNGGGNAGPKFTDLGGMNGVVEELKMEVIVPLYHPHLPLHLGVRPMAGILLHGPPGCGKTKLAHAIANETGVPFYKISATELVSGISGKDLITQKCTIIFLIIFVSL